MTPITDVNEMRKIQMDILLFVHQFCIDNHILYSLAWGTMLDVIRYKGYILWDDDIDIMMTRPGNDRFCKLFHDDRSILKTTYGDYMTLPPIDQRCVHEVVGMYLK